MLIFDIIIYLFILSECVCLCLCEKEHTNHGYHPTSGVFIPFSYVNVCMIDSCIHTFTYMPMHANYRFKKNSCKSCELKVKHDAKYTVYVSFFPNVKYRRAKEAFLLSCLHATFSRTHTHTRTYTYTLARQTFCIIYDSIKSSPIPFSFFS